MESVVRLFLCAMICICVTQPVWGQDLNYTATWYNQLGSSMTLSLNNVTSFLTGEYFTAVLQSDGTSVLKRTTHFVPVPQPLDDDSANWLGPFEVADEESLHAPGAPIVGFASRGVYNSSTFGFVAAWFDAAYIASWSGEYKVCQNEHVLFTSWILKPVTDNCRSAALSTRTGTDCFTKFPQIPADGQQCQNRTNPCRTPC
ncbi:Fibropellin-1 [Holothuria leucospilota]|uniref:Fibropellin-1 n=1 Tax=Holothuria leucospilota TaxID=206669 RepID=A0A9Q1CEQ7_HOLLE|nr:Fibropellin-1 [Holothuria leucospilota]